MENVTKWPAPLWEIEQVAFNQHNIVIVIYLQSPLSSYIVNFGISDLFLSNENCIFSINPPLMPGKVFDIFKVCSAGQFIAAFPITVILKKMRKRTELCSKFLGDSWIKRKYEALWNFFYIYGNAEERKWNLSKKKFYWTNAGFCEDLLWTRNSALFGLLDVQHFLFGRFLISKLEGIFFN